MMRKYKSPSIVISEWEEDDVVVCSTLINTGQDGDFGSDPDEGWEEVEGEW